MSAGWVAGNVRAKAMLNRRIGPVRARELAGCPSLGAAQQALANSSFRREVHPGQTLAESEFGLRANLLWQCRVLAGWQPPTGAGMVRALAGGFEVANICALARMLAGMAPQPLFTLGGLALAWSRLQDTGSTAELRAALAASPWGDPGSDAPADIALAVQLTWARRVAAGAPEAAGWASGAAALIVARRLFVERREPTAAARRAAMRLLGENALTATDMAALAAAVPAGARWALSQVTSPDELWQAEFGWWRHVERSALALLNSAQFDSAAPLATIALLAVDGWRVRAALQLAAAGGGPLEVYDALA